MFSLNLKHTLIGNKPSQMKLWQLAWPMILANISVPLLGFVDTAVIGNLGSADFLAGTALGSLIVALLFWLFGFLRMSTTGLVAKAYGEQDPNEQVKIVWQSLFMSLMVSLIVLLNQNIIFEALQMLVTSQDMQSALLFAQEYYDVRIYITPIALMNLVLSGYLIAVGATKTVLKAVLVCNFVNLAADLIIVTYLNQGVTGLAFASVLAELVLALVYIKATLEKLPNLIRDFNVSVIRFNSQLLTLNGNLFIRSCFLQFSISYMAIRSGQLGAEFVALNAIFMQFFLFISFSMDGIAYALESFVGRAFGANQTKKMKLYVRSALTMASKWALFYCFIYLLFAEQILNLLTNINGVLTLASAYLVWVFLLPLVSYLSFIFDGVFVGLAWSKRMMFTMGFATVCFIVTLYVTNDLLFHGLWFSFYVFLLARGLSQAFVYKTSI